MTQFLSPWYSEPEPGMDTTDKIFYYCGIVGIVLTLAIIVMAAIGVISGGVSSIGKAIFGLVVGIGLFLRGYAAKRKS